MQTSRNSNESTKRSETTHHVFLLSITHSCNKRLRHPTKIVYQRYVFSIVLSRKRKRLIEDGRMWCSLTHSQIREMVLVSWRWQRCAWQKSSSENIASPTVQVGLKLHANLWRVIERGTRKKDIMNKNRYWYFYFIPKTANRCSPFQFRALLETRILSKISIVSSFPRL